VRGALIGIDLGTSGLKGLLVTPGGEVLAQAQASYPLLTERPGWSEQRPEDWWVAAQEVLGGLAAQARRLGREPLGLGLSGQMHGAVVLDRKLSPLRPAMLWNDSRSEQQCRWIEQRVGKERLREICGNPALVGFQAPKLLWLRDREPTTYAAIRKVVLPKDYLRLQLSGELATDVSDASGTLLLDLAARTWSAELLELLELPVDWLPAVLESPEVAGYLSAEAAGATGLPAGLPIVAGAGDNAAAALGCGVVEEGQGLLSLGTSGVLFTPTPQLRTDPSGAIHAMCHAVPGSYHLMGVTLSAGGSLRWFRERWAGESSYAELDQLAAGVEPGAAGVRFLPYLTGERSPHRDPRIRGAFLGLSLAHGRAELTRAVLEGVAFSLWEVALAMEALGGKPQSLRGSGGGLDSALWRQILAAVLETPIERSGSEGPALGAAVLASVGAAVHPDVRAAAAAMASSAGTEMPSPDLASRYQPLREEYRRLYPALKASGLW
jgi:xylulokinase